MLMIFAWLGLTFFIFDSGSFKINTEHGYNLVTLFLAISAFLFIVAESKKEKKEKKLKKELLHITLNLFKFTIVILFLITIINGINTKEFETLQNKQLFYNSGFWFYMICAMLILGFLFYLALLIVRFITLIEKEHNLSAYINKQFEEMQVK